MKKYLGTVSRLTGVKMSKLEEYVKTGMVSELLNNADALDIAPTQKEKMEALKDFLLMHNEMCTVNEVETVNNNSKAMAFARGLLRFKDREQMFAICLNSQNRVINYSMVSEGTVNEAAVYPRSIAEFALQNKRCVSVILAHNHPGGTLMPSRADIDVTKKVKEVLNHLRIDLHDHIIVTDEHEYSMRENDDYGIWQS